jgi:hypothetical protein
VELGRQNLQGLPGPARPVPQFVPIQANREVLSQNRGLVQVKSPEQVTAELEGTVERYDPLAAPIDLGAIRHSFLAGHIKSDWENAKNARQQIDQRLLLCMRRRKGEYSTQELNLIARSGANNAIYMPIAATKCRALAAWLREILLQPGDRPCGLEPRPIPKLPEPLQKACWTQAYEKARAMMVDQVQAGQGVMDPQVFAATAKREAGDIEDAVKAEIRRQAKTRASKMEDTVFQIMDDGNFDAAFAQYIEYFSTYPTAVLKGPYPKRTKNLTWGPGWRPIVESKVVQTWKALDPLDCYPANLAESCQDRAFIERMRLTKADLFDMIGVEGYDEDAIRWVLNSHSGGLLTNWIWTDSERARLQADSTFNWFSKDEIIDALHYWGSVPGATLMMWGIRGLDPERLYEIDAILIASRVITCSLNRDPLGRRPYRNASYEKVPGSFWGRGVPELCASDEDMCNASARAMANNAGFASGPMVGVNVDRLPAGESITELYPFKIFQFIRDESGGSSASNMPLEFYQASMNVEPLIKLFDKFDAKSDDSTGIPRYTYGNEKIGGAGQTLGGLNMLMSAAAKGVRRAIGEIDVNVISETVYDTFVHAMLYVAENDAKGDCIVVPRGSAALLIKDQVQMGRQTFLQVVDTSPRAFQLVGWKGYADTLREFAKGLHLSPDLIPDGPELDQRIKQIEAAEAAMAQPAQAGPTKEELDIKREDIASRERIAGAQIAKDVALKPTPVQEEKRGLPAKA